jgi:hypothetical protein
LIPLSPKKLTLDFDYDFAVLGIVSAAPSYKLCHFINSETFMNFERNEEDFSILLNGQKEATIFSKFNFNPKNSEYYFSLIQNKGSNAYLVPEKKELDYFIIISDEFPNKIPLEVKNELTKLKVVQAVFLLPTEKIKSKENLIF